MGGVIERTGTCVICMERDPLPELEPVCGPCRSRLANQLREIPLLCDLLAAGPRPQVSAGDQRTVELVEHEVGDDGSIATRTEVRRERPVDIAAAAVPGQSKAPRVRGSRGRPMPISADVTDLLDIADERTVGDYHQVPVVRPTGETTVQTTWFGGTAVRQELRVRETVSVPRAPRCRCGHPELHERTRPVMVPAADQVGHVSVASVLNGWVRDFAETRREVGPEPLVPLLARYLADRLDWAFEHHGAVDEFAGEVSDVWHALYRTAGLPKPQPELLDVPCRNCDLRLLHRTHDYVECDPEGRFGGCQDLLTEAEYAAWAKLVVGALCATRNGDWWCALPKKHPEPCEPAPETVTPPS